MTSCPQDIFQNYFYKNVSWKASMPDNKQSIVLYGKNVAMSNVNIGAYPWA